MVEPAADLWPGRPTPAVAVQRARLGPGTRHQVGHRGVVAVLQGRAGRRDQLVGAGAVLARRIVDRWAVVGGAGAGEQEAGV